ncbi:MULTISPECIES: hypothetical protein [unclassified Candidatus Frackibacter]|uniref:hypothetical protein n=1 Tax=unclassified Candidatus Frackibacter TaxID=2648818 RepID=UPI000882F22D|nr:MULTISPECIES: hypothetical protein [unclassified Candidatus Frackibacter]SDC02355.1 hypothetical protein SAMN04515661_101325 [Candidatus Frackibacter sp. WG11]SEM69929.1 hypothetical protein SAMN04488698_11285 [Candidatus Frackibacter sp. WG12]SFL81158.1 hypothetical protein SAMN04488699_11485 [Candidatus Frackibacter sp. WG13]
MTKERINIFTGDYGSGKTEISINYALELAAKNDKVKLVDLDIVNPYFRSREAKEPLMEADVEVVAPAGKLVQADLPALPPQILGAIQDKNSKLIFDVGGEENGTIALGRFRQYLDEVETNVNFVINPNRPFTGDSAGVKEVINKIEKASRLKVDYLISNPNLGRETKVNDIIEGHKQLEEISEELGIPIKFLVISQEMIDRVNLEEFSVPVFTLKLFMKAPWE